MKSVTRFIQLRNSQPLASPNHWYNMAPMLTPRTGHGLVEVGEDQFVYFKITDMIYFDMSLSNDQCYC